MKQCVDNLRSFLTLFSRTKLRWLTCWCSFHYNNQELSRPEGQGHSVGHRGCEGQTTHGAHPAGAGVKECLIPGEYRLRANGTQWVVVVIISRPQPLGSGRYPLNLHLLRPSSSPMLPNIVQGQNPAINNNLVFNLLLHCKHTIFIFWGMSWYMQLWRVSNSWLYAIAGCKCMVICKCRMQVRGYNAQRE